MHGFVSNFESANLINSCAPTSIVHHVYSLSGQYVLSVKCKTSVEHWKIYLEEQGLTIFRDQYFVDLESLIYHYKEVEFLKKDSFGKDLKLTVPQKPYESAESNEMPKQNIVKTMLLGLGNFSEVMLPYFY